MAPKLKTVLAIIGNAASFGLYLSPLYIFKNILARRSVEEGFNPFPYLSTLMNCLIWILYELPIVNPNNILLLVINSVGAVIEMVYLAVIIKFATNRNIKNIVIWVVLVELLSSGTLLGGMLLWIPLENRTNFIGGFCVASGIVMYGSTLPTLVSSWRTGTTDGLPLAFVLVGLVNTSIWLAYGIHFHDLFIVIQDGIGLALCTTQLIVYSIVRFRADPTPA